MNVTLKDSGEMIISSSEKAYELMKDVFSEREAIDKDRENVWVICLNNANRIICVEFISMGTCNEVIVTPREVFCTPLRRRACKIIIVHNHPSGDVFPSPTDIDMTDNLVQVGKIIDIEVVDHLIIDENNFYSFKDCGLIFSDCCLYQVLSDKRRKIDKIKRRIEINLR